MERIAYTKESLCGDGHCHEDCPAETDAGHWVDDVREADGVGIGVQIKGFEGVVDATDDDVGCVKASQSHQKLMETITKFWF